MERDSESANIQGNEVESEGVDIDLAEEVDIEDLVKNGKAVPPAHRYIIRIDAKKYTVESYLMTGRELLALAGLTPETHKLYQHVKGSQPVLVTPDQTVDLRGAGVERFTTMPKDTTEGQGNLAPRRDFQLPAEDEEYLDSLGLAWEAVKDGGILWTMICGWSVPQGYTQDRVDLALMIPGDYPDAQIDMVYFSPALARNDGKPINALADHAILGKTWQRWSRHRTAANPWRVGEDGVAAHLALVSDWLQREVG